MGYIGYSMSENAVHAYENGERPLSKWTKALIIQEVKEEYSCYGLTFDFNLFSKLKTDNLKNFLYKSSWHHTSSRYNETDFYLIDYDLLQNLTNEKINNILLENKIELQLKKSDLKALEAQAQEQKQERKQPIKRLCSFLIWSGSRKHPTSKRVNELCEVNQSWAFTSHGKKSIKAKGFEFLN